MSITWFEQMTPNRRVLLHWRLVTCYSYQWCRIGYSSKVLKSCQMSKKTIALLLFICSNTCNLWFHIFVKLCSYSYMDHVNCVKKWVSFLVFILDLLFRILGLGWVRVDLEPVWYGSRFTQNQKRFRNPETFLIWNRITLENVWLDFWFQFHERGGRLKWPIYPWVE
jgi:hypothetical protein